MLRPMQRYAPKERRRSFCAYDLETSSIKEGTPVVKYLTVYGDSFSHSEKTEDFFTKLETCMFRDDRHRMRYVAWNGNRFDALLVISEIIATSDRYRIRPYLTKSGVLRGARIERGDKWWELLDGMAMLGFDAAGGWPLKRFLELYAPELPKGELDFDAQEFDPDNPDHVAYAERDSEGLFHALVRVDDKLREISGKGMQVTIGNAGIKFMQRNLPEGVLIWEPPASIGHIIHEYVMRGGYCHTQRRYQGDIWQADLNQAYAAAMRDAELPAGSVIRTHRFEPNRPGIYRCQISHRKCPVPFYCKDMQGNAGFTYGRRIHTWITSIEVKRLKARGWKVKIREGAYWTKSFNLRTMVDKLETLRRSDPLGPSGPIGTIAKQLGNASYGKTVERIDRTEIIVAREAPKGFMRYKVEDDNYRYFWFRFQPVESSRKVYHQPQIGAFITAHVRMLVWDAALEDHEHFVKCDTDSVAFSRPIAHLKIDPIHYGDWKLEIEGKPYVVIAKKVYASLETKLDPKMKQLVPVSAKAKGLNVKRLTMDDFFAWYNGQRPEQIQIQKRSFRRFLSGEAMFAKQKRKGTDPKAHAPPINS